MGLVSWLWDFGDGYTSEEQNPPNHVYTEGVYTVNLTIEENDGDVNNYSISDFIVVGPQPNISPIADFVIESAANPVIHQSILFTDTSTDSDGTITSWNWNFGDQTTSTARNPTHQYQNPGVYTITLTVTDDDGASQDTAQQISISEKIAPITSHDYDGLWHNKDFVISLSSQDYQSGVKETYYKINGGSTKSLMNDGQPQINEESSNNVLEFWSVDNLGNEELHNILTNIKLDKTPPVAYAGQNVTVNEDTLLTFNGSNSGDNLGIIEYTWILNDGTRKELNTIAPEYVFHTPGVYTVELIVVDAANNLAIDTFEIKVLDVTDPIANAGNDLIINQGETVKFDGSKSTDNIKIADFVWSFIDETPQKIEGVNATYTFWFVGVYEINLTVYDEQGNLGTDLILVTVIDNTWPIADAGFDQIVEEGAMVYFDGSNSFDNIGIENYLWTFTDGELQSLNGVNANYSFGIPGIYEVTLTVSDLEEHSANDTVMIFVRDITSPKIEFTEFSEIIEGTPSTFDASKSYDASGIDSFYWIFGDGTMENSSSPSVTHTYAEFGTYALELFVTDKSGNVNSDVISVYVNPDPNADFSSDQLDEKDEGEKLVDNNKLNSDLDNLDITNANINPEDEGLTEPEDNQSKTNPENNYSVGFSLGTILTIVIILLLTSYVLYVKWEMRIDKFNKHQNTL
ncbi:hypothetical protein AC477_05830 [miscellaneous Crenarchaeota group-1 archaeon SG8-32-1]|uniref:PKD domain-containing protein n=1 Tax=miscellaneous Crenarchaeota group-1 archaeon SG8-32-1 TaxID=1685124 RepID=A0A0M0BLR9_9ARCH|nr:MAG: hypothetical protein AC477_05830 [miscellaneous Crenarchaeota group-1 archaeon SG8-32-1]